MGLRGKLMLCYTRCNKGVKNTKKAVEENEISTLKINISSKHVTSIFISVTMSTEIVSVSDDANCDDAPQEKQGCLLLIGRHGYPTERIL